MKHHWMKTAILCVPLMLVLGSCQNHGSASREFLLSDGWKVQSSAKVLQSGEMLSTSQADVKNGMKQWCLLL